MPASRPRITVVLASTSAIRADAGDHGRLHEVGCRRAPSPWIDEMVARGPRSGRRAPAMDRDAGRRDSKDLPRWPRRGRDPQHPDDPFRLERVGDPDLERVARCDGQRHVAVRVDDRAGEVREQRQGTVREPALGDAVEIEGERVRPLDEASGGLCRAMRHARASAGDRSGGRSRSAARRSARSVTSTMPLLVCRRLARPTRGPPRVSARRPWSSRRRR